MMLILSNVCDMFVLQWPEKLQLSGTFEIDTNLQKSDKSQVPTDATTGTSTKEETFEAEGKTTKISNCQRR